MLDTYRTGDAIAAGSTDVSLFVLLRRTADNVEATGKASGSVTLSYARTRGLRVAVTPSALAAPDDPHSDGGWSEIDATNQPGLYRVDLPDAAFAAGAAEVVVTVKASSCYAAHLKFALPSGNEALPAIADTEDGTTAEAARAMLNYARGKKEVVEVSGQWKLRIYHFDDPATVWAELDVDHPVAPASVVPA